MDIDHPEIEEFINIRKESGGDINRKCLNLHNGINLTNEFLQAVKNDDDWRLIDPKTKEAVKIVSARELWWQILNARAETGEPYMVNIDNCNDALPKPQKDLGLEIKQSNLCSEITLPTNEERTAVCCLSSVNLEHFDEWSKDETDSLWSLGTNRQKGVAILVNPRLKREGISYSNELIDSNGRYIKIIVNINGTLYRLVCIYAPPNDKARARVKFFIHLNNNILNDEFDCETIMGGDYNCTLNADMDRLNCVCKNNDLGQIDLYRLIQTHELEDMEKKISLHTGIYMVRARQILQNRLLVNFQIIK